MSESSEPNDSEQTVPAGYTWADKDIPAHMMDLARHLHAESRDLGDHVRDSERGDGSELTAAIYQARADALMDAARYIRRTAKWLDGEGERPAELEHGAALTGTDQPVGVPWRDEAPGNVPTDSNQENGGDA